MAEVARSLHVGTVLDIKLPRLPKAGDGSWSSIASGDNGIFASQRHAHLLARQFRREQIDLLNVGRRAEQRGCVGHQCCRNRAS